MNNLYNILTNPETNQRLDQSLFEAPHKDIHITVESYQITIYLYSEDKDLEKICLDRQKNIREEILKIKGY